jgi:hypothetical protein
MTFFGAFFWGDLLFKLEQDDTTSETIIIRNKLGFFIAFGIIY